jgi:hypothetical protein
MFTSLEYKKEIFLYYGIFDGEDLIKDNIGRFIEQFSLGPWYPSYYDFYKLKDIFNYYESKQKCQKQLSARNKYFIKILI